MAAFKADDRDERLRELIGVLLSCERLTITAADANGNTAPHHWARYTHDSRSLLATLRALSARKPNWNARNAAGETVLHRAATNIAVPTLVATLLDEVDAVEVDALTRRAMSPLHYAVLANNIAAIEALLARGARADLKVITAKDAQQPVSVSTGRLIVLFSLCCVKNWA